MKAIFVNGSPRKQWNTHMLLQEAMLGAADAGFDTELIHLADYPVTGCKSCFACKRKGSDCGGVCAIRDELQPVYQRIMEADVLVIGSPVYFGGLSALTQAFLERLLFPVHEYKKPVNGIRPRVLPKAKKLGLIVSMNCPAQVMARAGYPERFAGIAGILSELLSDENCPVLYACDTLQFSDYSRYDVDMFDPVAKHRQREEQFPVDLQKAHDFAMEICKG